MATRDLSPAALGSLEDDVIYPFLAVELRFDGDRVLRLWSGTWPLVLDGLTYTPTGALMGVSTIEETAEVAVRGATLTLSGIPQEIIALALNEPYQGREAKIFLGMFSKGYLLAEDGSYLLAEDGTRIPLEDQSTGLTEIFGGYMDEMNIDEGVEASSIEVKAENELIRLERPHVMRYTDAYQQTLHPGDAFFSKLVGAQDKVIPWGSSGNKAFDDAFYGTFFGGVL